MNEVAFADGGHAFVQTAPLRVVLSHHDDGHRRNFRQPLMRGTTGHRVTESGENFCSDVDTVGIPANNCKALDTVNSRGFVYSVDRHAFACDSHSL